MPVSILIIGIGNEYRSDDVAGLLAARMLRTLSIPALPENAIIESDGDGAALLDLWQAEDTVILIDASFSGLPAGTITRFDPLDYPIPPSLLVSSHAFGLAEAIELARRLDTLPRSLVVYAIEGKNFFAGMNPSPEIEQAARAVAQQIMVEWQTSPASDC